ncbi:MAG: DUF1990 family protein [Solirubrobacteraceae bacterium]
MPRRPSAWRRLTTATRWPVGVTLTSWRYMWRTTPIHRTEEDGLMDVDAPPALPAGVSHEEVQDVRDGAGPLFHRRYRTRIRESALTPAGLIDRVSADLDAVAPTEFASFQKVRGEQGTMRVGDEYVVRMPGPWDGPVRVVAREPQAFRLATLVDHLEAGQIEFRARVGDDDTGHLVFEIESWARSGSRVVNLLYDHLRMAKETQLHMWTSLLERVAASTGGRMTGGIDIHTRRAEVEDG